MFVDIVPCPEGEDQQPDSVPSETGGDGAGVGVGVGASEDDKGVSIGVETVTITGTDQGETTVPADKTEVENHERARQREIAA